MPIELTCQVSLNRIKPGAKKEAVSYWRAGASVMELSRANQDRQKPRSNVQPLALRRPGRNLIRPALPLALSAPHALAHEN